MKKIFLLALIVICYLPACKKSEPVSPGLFGKWELRRRYGGLAGMDSIYKAGNGYIIQFNSDSTYSRYVKRKLANTGTFHINTSTNPQANSVDEIYFDNAPYGDPFMLNGTKMTIGTVIADGIAADYEKIRN